LCCEDLSNRRPASRVPLSTHESLFAAKNTIKADEIAAYQTWALNQHLGPREKKLHPIDVKEMFLQMRDQVCANLAAR
jgi:hypothetical protein